MTKRLSQPPEQKGKRARGRSARASLGAGVERDLDPARLRDVLGRLTSGYYDSDAVLAAVADEVAHELGFTPS